MNRDYRFEGYQEGYDDGLRTGGKVSRKYIDCLFKCKTQHLNSDESCEYVNGWQDGFEDGVRGKISKFVHREDVLKGHGMWEEMVEGKRSGLRTEAQSAGKRLKGKR